MKLGFTGTRRGMTPAQRTEVARLLRDLPVDEFHHGDCVGADEDAHLLCRTYQPTARIIIHPPSDPSLRARRRGDEVRPELDYLKRNKRIVAETDAMLVVPRQAREELRSGTWSTYRHARRLGRRTILITPAGTVIDRGGSA